MRVRDAPQSAGREPFLGLGARMGAGVIPLSLAVEPGPVGIPGQILIFWGVGTIAFLALLVGTSAVRPRAPAPDPLVASSLDESDIDEGGAWRRASTQVLAFEDGRELARHASPSTLEDLVATLRALDIGDARMEVVRHDATRVTLKRCATCGGRGWLRRGRRGCARERGFLLGAFESLAGGEVTVEELRCEGRKDACVFTVTHPPLPR